MALTREQLAALDAAVVQAKAGSSNDPTYDDGLVKVYTRDWGDSKKVVVEFGLDLPKVVQYEWYLACRDRTFGSYIVSLHNPEGHAFTPR